MTKKMATEEKDVKGTANDKNNNEVNEVNKETKNGEKEDNSAEETEVKEKPSKSKNHKEKPSKEEELMAKLTDCEEKINELQDKYLRVSAEFDNYRKRTVKEKMELVKTAGDQLLSSLLPVVDDFERGLKTINEAKETDPIKEGINLIYNKFKDYLNQNGVREIEALNKNFNVELHEAISVTPAPNEEMKGKVIDVIEKGYTLNDKVLRYSKVVIGE